MACVNARELGRWQAASWRRAVVSSRTCAWDAREGSGAGLGKRALMSEGGRHKPGSKALGVLGPHARRGTVRATEDDWAVDLAGLWNTARTLQMTKER